MNFYPSVTLHKLFVLTYLGLQLVKTLQKLKHSKPYKN